MLVENWTENFTPSRGTDGLKRQDASISKRAYARLCREAKERLEGYSLDFKHLSGPTLAFYNMTTCTATWTHKITGQEIELTEIWFEKKSGEINQAGTNYGRLSL